MKFFIILLITMNSLFADSFSLQTYKYQVIENGIILSQCKSQDSLIKSKIKLNWIFSEAETIDLRFKIRVCTKYFGLKKQTNIVPVPAYMADYQQRAMFSIGETRVTSKIFDRIGRELNIIVKRLDDKIEYIQGHSIVVNQFQMTWKKADTLENAFETVELSFIKSSDFFTLFNQPDDALSLYSITIKNEKPIVGLITIKGFFQRIDIE